MEFSRKQTGCFVGLNVLTERKTRYTLLSPLTNKTAGETTKTIIKRLGEYDPEKVKSLTLDNGSENIYLLQDPVFLNSYYNLARIVFYVSGF